MKERFRWKSCSDEREV